MNTLLELILAKIPTHLNYVFCETQKTAEWRSFLILNLAEVQELNIFGPNCCANWKCPNSGVDILSSNNICKPSYWAWTVICLKLSSIVAIFFVTFLSFLQWHVKTGHDKRKNQRDDPQASYCFKWLGIILYWERP